MRVMALEELAEPIGIPIGSHAERRRRGRRAAQRQAEVDLQAQGSSWPGMSGTGYRIGVDIGGTFTDAVVVSATGDLVVGKVSRTPADFASGFFDAIDAAAAEPDLDAGALLRQTAALAHGTTVGINALVTGDVARVAFPWIQGLASRRIH